MTISVVIPTYNRSSTIRMSIQSVLDQTIEPLEIIVVDDYSTDNTKEIVQCMNNNKVKYVLNSSSKGANGARNTGIKLALGEYIAFQDSDDIWLPHKLEKQFNFMKDNERYSMCFSSLMIINDNRVIPKRRMQTNEIKQAILMKNFISTQTIFIKREVAMRYLFDEKIKRFQDWDFCLRVLKDHEIKHIDEILVHIEIQNDSITLNENILNAYRSIFEKFPEVKNSCYLNKSLNQKILFYSFKNKKQYLTSLKHIVGYLWYKLLERITQKAFKY